jgi:phenylalanyl-tRNA synthetase beta chain
VPPPRHPDVQRDLAVVVAENRPAAAVAASIRRHGGPLLRDVALFDIYRGAPLADHDKSLAHRLTFRAAERTLTEAEIDDAIAAIAAGLAADVAARLRA